MTHLQRATTDQVTVEHYAVSGGQLTVTRAPARAPIYRLNGFKITYFEAKRKLAA
ncbi:hypothetical protein HOU03_gp143 [Caulobacter phage CcrSC]|uniref:Uncharacterized protein n=1 Tax=Caulobacter phage CcrSC TaxID=2283272 RepID=A0A385EF23_9CAUD|nr:hypothetical protein HOU03_gp043 [Caulobacter phage CcrSC]YP_009810755.1 hypothetical protein HOU03_gp143 [Caulobacter phage CcrSC]AXQ69625.1 hypothetical protein CcrSC_gp043 [Caulobacter phage CcrSC]AXQ70125.1 hypothetical protein CcrSC_gp543 [Caulobacter phage CcrSC]